MDSAIEISSDSDVEIQETRTRLPLLPPRLAEGSHRRDLSTLIPHFLSGNSSNANILTKLGLPIPSSRNGFEAKPRTEHHTNFARNGDHIGSQQAVKRILPPAFSRPPMPLRPDIGTSNGNASHFRGDYVSPAVSSSGSTGNIGGSYGGPRDGIGMGRVINGARIFPPSVAHGTAASTSHFIGGSDQLHRNGIGEDRNSENDETLIYQAALQNLNQPKSETDLPAGLLSVPLMKHQKIALAWM